MHIRRKIVEFEGHGKVTNWGMRGKNPRNFGSIICIGMVMGYGRIGRFNIYRIKEYDEYQYPIETT